MQLPVIICKYVPLYVALTISRLNHRYSGVPKKNLFIRVEGVKVQVVRSLFQIDLSYAVVILNSETIELLGYSVCGVVNYTWASVQ